MSVSIFVFVVIKFVTSVMIEWCQEEMGNTTENITETIYNVIGFDDVNFKWVDPFYMYEAINGWQLAKMKKSIPDMSLP